MPMRRRTKKAEPRAGDPPSDAGALRRRAREGLEEGAVTRGYRADLGAVLRLLDTALATELVCVLRYRRHAYTATGIHSESVAAEFLRHAVEEQDHADRIAKRIVQLGGEPDLSPEGLAARSRTEYDDSAGLAEMIREDLVAERVAIESYMDAVRTVGDGDPTTRRLLESILAAEEEHAVDLLQLLGTVDRPAPGDSEGNAGR